MTWEIRLAHRDRGQPLADLLDCQRELSKPERAVARHVVAELATKGCRTAGDVVDLLERATPSERRALLDGARVAQGLPDIATADAHDRVASATAASVKRARTRWQACHAEGCPAVPRDPATGADLPSPFRKYWCPEHRGQASPDDLLPWRQRLAYGPSGDVIDLDEREAQRRQAEG